MLINVTGPAMARRGDRIRCTVLFEEEPDEDGKIPVFFTLNGRKIVLQSGESRFLMDFKKPLFPFIGMTKGSSVLTKVRTTRTPTPAGRRGGGYSHTLRIRVCAVQRGRDFEAPDLERGIHFGGVF